MRVLSPLSWPHYYYFTWILIQYAKLRTHKLRWDENLRLRSLLLMQCTDVVWCCCPLCMLSESTTDHVIVRDLSLQFFSHAIDSFSPFISFFRCWPLLLYISLILLFLFDEFFWQISSRLLVYQLIGSLDIIIRWGILYQTLGVEELFEWRVWGRGKVWEDWERLRRGKTGRGPNMTVFKLERLGTERGAKGEGTRKFSMRWKWERQSISETPKEHAMGRKGQGWKGETWR